MGIWGVFYIRLREHEQVFWFIYKTSAFPSLLPSVLTDGAGSGNLESQPSFHPMGCGEAGSAAVSGCSQLLQGQAVVPALCRQVTPYGTANPLDPWWIVSCINTSIHVAK